MRELPPNDAIAAATFFSSFSLRASKRSSPAPATAISLAIAAPTPLDAPVTRTVLPLISMRVLPRSVFDSQPRARRNVIGRRGGRRFYPDDALKLDKPVIAPSHE